MQRNISIVLIATFFVTCFFSTLGQACQPFKHGCMHNHDCCSGKCEQHDRASPTCQCSKLGHACNTWSDCCDSGHTNCTNNRCEKQGCSLTDCSSADDCCDPYMNRCVRSKCIPKDQATVKDDVKN